MTNKPTAHRKLAEARILAARLMPYMRHSIMALLPTPMPGLGTMAVDEYGRLYYDAAFLEGRDLKHLAFVVLHEVLHVFGKHPKRGKAILGTQPAKDRLAVWRKAVDASVNDILEESGLRCPDEGVTPAKLGLPRNKTPEDYFGLLCKAQEAQEQAEQAAQQQQQEQQDQQEQGQDSQEGEGQPDDGEESGQEQDNADAGDGDESGEESPADGQPGAESDGEGEPSEGDGAPGDGNAECAGEAESAVECGGSSSDGQPRPWELGEPTPENPGMAEHEQNLIEAATAKAIEEAIHARGKGSVPNALAKSAGEFLHPVVDPTKELASRVKYAIDCTSGFGAFTYAKPSCRQQRGGIVLPAHQKPIPRATVIIDTSGSMQADDLAKALDVLANALRNLPDPRGLRVLVGGTRVEQAKNVFRPDQIELLEGGGTDMAALIVAAAEERPAPKVIVVCSDGETGWPSEPVQPIVVVALTRKPRWMSMPPEWCDTVLLNPEE